MSRLRNDEVISRWLSGKEVWPSGLWSDDRALYSYGVPIAYRDMDHTAGKLVIHLAELPVDSSKTTLRHRERVRRCAERFGMLRVGEFLL